MKRVLSSQLPTPDRPVLLPENEADHLTRVLRLRDGDVIEALDGRGHSALVTLRIKGGGPRIEFLKSQAPTAMQDQGVPPVILEVSILKGDAMEWVIEKAVELGVQKLIPVMTAHTVVQLKSKGPEAFRERWQKIADQALKQCGRLEKLEVQLPIPLENLLAQQHSDAATPRLWFDEAGRNELPSLSEWIEGRSFEGLSAVRLLVGPEGGWSDLERELILREADTFPLGLGPWVLRAETAALFAASLITARFRAKSLTTADR